MSMRRPRRAAQHRVRRDRWLVSYADFMTLLFAFFVVMYALSSINEHKYRELSDSLNDAFSSVTARDVSPDPRRAEADAREHDRLQKLRDLAKGLEAALQPLNGKGPVRIVQSARGVTVEIGASALFAPADAHLHNDALDVLSAVAAVLATSKNALRIEGHTDSNPIATSVYPSNWELSAARASAVARLLVEQGVQGSRIGVTGYADNRPVGGNGTAEGRARNRRVTLLIMADMPDEIDTSFTSSLLTR